VKPVGAPRYTSVKDVNREVDTVDDLISRWAIQTKLSCHLSQVTLHLVSCSAHKPSEQEEAAAVELADPSFVLAEAGITGTAWLLARVVKPAESPGACQQGPGCHCRP
jgi:hypothetical protein